MKTMQETKSTAENGNNLSQQNKNLIHRAVDEIWNSGNYDTLDEFITKDFVIHLSSPGKKIQGIEGVKKFYTELRSAFPDIHFTVENMIAEDDKVVTEWIAHATHKGEFNGIPATGKRVTLTAVDIDRLVDGKIVECWSKVDELNLLQQLGVVPTH